LQGGLHARFVAFFIIRRSLGSSHRVCPHKEIVVLFVVIVKHRCHPRRLNYTVIVVLLLLLLLLHFSGLLFLKTI
jgi:hypothetical protein